jgi:hypothetical protein
MENWDRDTQSDIVWSDWTLSGWGSQENLRKSNLHGFDSNFLDMF